MDGTGQKVCGALRRLVQLTCKGTQVRCRIYGGRDTPSPSAVDHTANELLATVRIKVRFFNIWMEGKDEGIKDFLYEHLERIKARCLRYDIKIALGEINDRVDKEEILGLTVRKFSLKPKRS